MNIQRVIDNVRRMRAGYEITDETAIELINRAEKDVFENIYKGREDAPADRSYSIDTDRSTELSVPEPYAELYQNYIAAHLDLETEDATRYENSAAAYTACFEGFKTFWFRNHKQTRKYQYHW